MPTLPLSGGNEKTVMASFLCFLSLVASLAQLMARLKGKRGGEGERPITATVPEFDQTSNPETKTEDARSVLTHHWAQSSLAAPSSDSPAQPSPA